MYPYGNGFGDSYEDNYVNNEEYIDLGWQQNNGMAGDYGFPQYFQQTQYQDVGYLDYDAEEAELEAEPDQEAVVTQGTYGGANPTKETTHPHLQSSQAPTPSSYSGVPRQSDSRTLLRPAAATFIPGINTPTSTTTPPNAAPSQDKAAAEERAAALRAKLMAQKEAKSRDTPGREKSAAPKEIPAQMQRPGVSRGSSTQPQRRESATDLDGLLAEAKAAVGAKAKPENGVQKPHVNGAPSSAMQSSETQAVKRTATPSGNVKGRLPGAQDVPQGTTQASKNIQPAMDSPELGEITDETPTNKPIEEPPQRTVSTLSARRSLLTTSTQVSPAQVKNAQSSNHDQSVTQASTNVSADKLQSAPGQPAKTPLALGSARSDKTNKEQWKLASNKQDNLQSTAKPSQTADTPRSDQAIATETPSRTDTDVVLTQPKAVTLSRRTSIQQERGEERALAHRETSTHEDSLDILPRNAAAYSHYFDDLDEWLEITGYHDVAYRQRHLRRQRALMELDAQRARIEQEAQEDEENRTGRIRTQSIRPQSVRPTDSNKSSSALAMPPPPRPEIIASSLVSLAPRSKDKFAQHTPISSDSTGSKRVRSPQASTGQERSEKIRRTSSDERPVRRNDADGRSAPSGRAPELIISRKEGVTNGIRIRGTVDEDSDAGLRTQSRPQSSRGRTGKSVSPLPLARRISLPEEHTETRRGKYDDIAHSHTAHRHGRDISDASHARQDSYDYGRPYSPSASHGWSSQYSERQDKYEPHGRSSIQYHHPDEPYNSRGRSRGRGAGTYHGGVRYSRGGAPHSVGRVEQSGHGAAALGLRQGGSRFFMIKSWNHDNVEASQRDGTWATQPHNEGLLAEAFHTSRNVILAFSVNKSMAFQGYARMESLPGTAPTPPWVKNLLWKSSPPFHVRWITVAETRFSRVGHLKNALNEDQPVLVGRDGQEIEEECGILLCETIDEERERLGGFG